MSLIYDAIRSAEGQPSGDLPPLPGRRKPPRRTGRRLLAGAVLALAGFGIAGSLLALTTRDEASPSFQALDEEIVEAGSVDTLATASSVAAPQSRAGGDTSDPASQGLPDDRDSGPAVMPRDSAVQPVAESERAHAPVDDTQPVAQAPEAAAKTETAGSPDSTSTPVVSEPAPDLQDDRERSAAQAEQPGDQGGAEPSGPTPVLAEEEPAGQIRDEPPAVREVRRTHGAEDRPDRQRIAEWVEVTRAGDLEAARSAVGKLREHLPEPSLTLLRAEAWVALRAGDHDRAERLYRTLLGRVPEDREATANLELISKYRQRQ
ncbi:MAG: hypothetical protein ACP5DC_00135 [Halothiobacillaceae bacterium]